MYNFIKRDVTSRFLKYIEIDSTSYSSVDSFPSSKGQMDMGALLAQELVELGAENITHDSFGYVYADMPGYGDTMTLCAHLDTSEAESGESIKPIIHKNYDGRVIRIGQSGLILDPEENCELKKYTGSDIITSSGDTLLGADDKAGIAEIMTLLAVLQNNPELPSPPLSIVFTPEEETGRGTECIDIRRLGRFGYTLDIGAAGEINDECFDAWRISLSFSGENMHPGYSYNKMGNAVAVAGRLISMLPAAEAPDTTKGRAGFYHVSSLQGDETEASAEILLRDFDEQENFRRMEYIESCLQTVLSDFPRVSVSKKALRQYRNMKSILDKYPEVVSRAEQAIRDAGMKVVKRPIRGGTDGAALTEKGIPMPNIFNGGMNAHSKTEWVAVDAMVKAVETLINLCSLHSEC